MSAKILVVDDLDPARQALVQELSDAGFQTVEAESGDTGWAQFNRHRPDLIISDVSMDGGTGMDLLRRVRSQSDIPVVLFTAFGSVRSAANAFRDGADDFIASNESSIQQLVDAGKRHPELKLMEAFMYRHHPQWLRARQIVRDGGVGELRTIQSAFAYFNDDAGNIRNVADMGGGAMMDIGCYPISLSRFLFDKEPERVFGDVEIDPRFQTDRLASAILDFGSGTSTFTCSTQLAPYQRVHIFGTEGRVEIEIPFNAPPDVPCKMWHQRGEEIEEIQLDTCDQYGIQGDLFARAILDDAEVPTPIEDAVANMRAIEAVFRSSESGRFEAM